MFKLNHKTSMKARLIKRIFVRRYQFSDTLGRQNANCNDFTGIAIAWS